MNSAPRKALGLIGFGQFGRLAVELLRSRYDILAHDAAGMQDDIAAAGARAGSLEAVAGQPVVVVAVPVGAMRQVFIDIAPHLQPGALVIDVGSVKMLPAQWMQELLPAHVDLVATHPLFGPQSARQGLEGQPMIIVPVRGERHHGIVALARDLGLNPSLTTAEEHDREMAYVQALTHLIGRALVNIDIPDEMLKTRSYQHLLDLTQLIGRDTFELFTAIQTENPYAADVVEAFVAEAQNLIRQVRPAR